MSKERGHPAAKKPFATVILCTNKTLTYWNDRNNTTYQRKNDSVYTDHSEEGSFIKALQLK